MPSQALCYVLSNSWFAAKKSIKLILKKANISSVLLTDNRLVTLTERTKNEERYVYGAAS
jgi:hypothetical protein